MSEPIKLIVAGAGPDPEAYSRVTNPERFLSLHTFALALLDRLGLEYEVLTTDVFTLTPNMTPFEQPHQPSGCTAQC
jgi:hypothetical protein